MSFDRSSMSPFEQQLLSDPRSAHTRELANAPENADGALKLARALRFERDLDAAFFVDVPADLSQKLMGIAATGAEMTPLITPFGATVPAPARFRRSRRWFTGAAVAASMMLATSAWLLNGGAGNLLAAHCALHLAHEPYALTRTEIVPKAIVTEMFAETGMQASAMPALNYLNLCSIDGMPALHAVVQLPGGPATVLIIPKARGFSVGDSHQGANMVRVTRVGDGGALVLLAENSRGFDALEMQLRAGLAADLADG
jgi:hypothetical protein